MTNTISQISQKIASKQLSSLGCIVNDGKCWLVLPTTIVFGVPCWVLDCQLSKDSMGILIKSCL